MNKRKKIIVTVLTILIIAALGGSIIWVREAQNFVFEKHLSDEAITIDDTKLQLKDATYYIMSMEQKVNDMAMTYNSEDPSAFWNTHYSAGENSVFMRDYAKTAAREQCIFYYVMEKEAKAAGISLTQEESERAGKEADTFYEQMSDKQKETTGITKEQLIIIYQRNKLVEKYVSKAVQSIVNQGYKGDAKEQLDYNGEFYQDQIRSKYQISKNDSLWDKMTLGSITIN